MKKTIQCIDQGDVRFIPVPKGTVTLPGQKPAKSEKTQLGDSYVVAHSETGHHHAVAVSSGAQLFESDNPFLALLTLPNNTSAEVVNLREHKPHAPAHLDPSCDYVVSRQAEWQPEGWRTAAD